MVKNSKTGLLKEILELLSMDKVVDEVTYQDFKKRLEMGNFSREEDPVSHFGTFLVPFNGRTKQILIVFHKKANQWIPAGGHVDKDETPSQTDIREAGEELGLTLTKIDDSFFFSIVEIDDPKRACRRHYDSWFLIPTKPGQVKIDMSEFNDARWVSLSEARKLMIRPAILAAIDRMEWMIGKV